MKSLPYSTDPIIVSQNMCDHNGHMNVKYYYQLFDDVYTKMYIENLGFDDDYLASGFSTFTLEDSIRYLREFKLHDNIYPSFYLYKVNYDLLKRNVALTQLILESKDNLQENFYLSN